MSADGHPRPFPYAERGECIRECTGGLVPLPVGEGLTSRPQGRRLGGALRPIFEGPRLRGVSVHSILLYFFVEGAISERDLVTRGSRCRDRACRPSVPKMP